MVESEAELLETLKNWKLLKNDLKRLKMRLDEKQYQLTASYSDTKSFGSGGTISKVETYCFAVMAIEDEIQKLKDTLTLCRVAYKTANLTEWERMTISCITSGGSLLQLSKKLGIAQAKVYRIRDKAVRKMWLRLQNAL